MPEPREFAEGWSIGEPDQVVYMRDEPVEVPAEGVIDYYHFVVDPGWKEDKWIMAAEAKPESLATVHHILVFIVSADLEQSDIGRGGGDGERGSSRPREAARGGGAGNALTNGNLIAGYAPGANAIFSRQRRYGRARQGRLEAAVPDCTTRPTARRSQIAATSVFAFTDPDKVKYEARSTAVVNTFFSIPPGESDYSATPKQSSKPTRCW